jgi:hypothetical protein
VKALVVTPTSSSIVDAPDNPEVRFHWLGSQVAGYLEAVTGSDWVAYLNEEGKLNGLPFNHRATQLATIFGWRGGGDVLVGNVVFFGRSSDGADEANVPERIIYLATAVPNDD